MFYDSNNWLFSCRVWMTNSSQVFRTLINILTDPYIAVDWMVSTHLLISSSFCTNPLVTVPSAPITINSPVTFIFHSLCFCFFLFSLFGFLRFYPVVSQNSKVHYPASPFLCWLSLGLVVWPRLNDPFVS